jgi:DNA-directed RNA polymerase I, II, and III subunit RPABC2|tara:strand:+ start:3352 stop:3867 length:516 start_codon:yes stop_codon:yes gene_type:complete
LSQTKDDKTTSNESEPILEMEETLEESNADAEVSVNASLEKAIETFRKIREQNGPLSDKELEELDKQCDVIRNREIIMSDGAHEIKELTEEGKILMGPPILTRFEKARIMGARALQLSLGAPTFIEIPENATTSLDIAMEELEQRLIPISIRRVLPNGDFQNIPLFEFKNE